MELFELDDLIYNLSTNPSEEQLNVLYAEFKRDFVTQEFVFKGIKVKIILHHSRVEGYEKYPETFVHLITRKGQRNIRVFDRHRANKIHWIRCILENYTDDEIIYFEYPESDQGIREYYWFKEGDFIVILERVTPHYVIVTSFHVDNARQRKYYQERETWYKKSK